MSRSEVNIPFLGVNRQPLDRQRRDGECLDIVNLRPEGPVDRIRWTPVRQPQVIESPGGNDQRAAGSIGMSQAAANPQPRQEATTFIAPTRAVQAGSAMASIIFAGSVTQPGTISVTLGNLPTQSGTFVIPVANGMTATEVADLTRTVLLQNFVGNALELVREADEFVPEVQYLRLIAKDTGPQTDNYTLAVSTSPANILIIDTIPFSGGALDPDSFFYDFTIFVGPIANGTVITIPVTITHENNSVQGIALAIAQQVNTLNIPEFSATLFPASGFGVVRLQSRSTAMPEVLNGAPVSTDANKILWSEFQPFLGGVNPVDDWGQIQVSIPHVGIQVSTPTIQLSESRTSIIGKIVAALQANPVFSANYEIEPLMGKSVTVNALNPGTAWNGQIVLSYENRLGNLIASALRGGSDPLDAISMAYWYKRVSRGNLSLDPTAGLSRMVALQNDRIVVSDPTKQNLITLIEPVPADTGRHFSFAQVDDIALMSLSRNDFPQEMRMLIDDTFFDYELPVPPRLSFSIEEKYYEDGRHDAFGLSRGTYAVRTAWVFADGSYSALSVPQSVVVTKPRGEGLEPREGWSIRYSLRVSAGPQELGKFDKLVEGIAVFVATTVSSSRDRGQRDVVVSGPRPGQGGGSNSVPAADQFSATQATLGNTAFDHLFYHVGNIEKEKGELTVSYSIERLFTLDNSREDNLFGIHKIKAAIVGSYNKRVLLGNTSVDFASPNSFVRVIKEGNAMTSRNIRIVVGLKAAGKEYVRIGEPLTITEDKIRLENPIAYPDRRAEWVEVWGNYSGEYVRLLSTAITGRGETSGPRARINLRQSARNNFSWQVSHTFEIPSAPPTYPEGVEDIEFYGTLRNTEVDHRPGRVYVSDPSNPFVIPAAQTYFAISQESTDPIQGFAVNALEVSTGQFGEFPLYLFTKNSVTALLQGAAELAFAGQSPVSNSLGAVNPNAIVNIERGIAFAAKSGVYFLPSQLTEPISEPIGPVVAGNLQNACLGYFRKGDTRELWLSNVQGHTWCLNLDYMRWYRRTGGVRKQFFKDGNILYGILSSEAVKEEVLALPVVVTIDTGKMTFGEPDLFKRVFMGSIKWNVTSSALPLVELESSSRHLLPASFRGSLFQVPFGAMKEYRLKINGTLNATDWIESFDVSVQFRYPHRRIR